MTPFEKTGVKENCQDLRSLWVFWMHLGYNAWLKIKRHIALTSLKSRANTL